MGKAFEKQIKTIEDHGKKQIDTLKVLEPKEEKKPIEDKFINHSKAKAIFSDLINKRKDLVKELHDKVDYKNLNFEYVDKKNNDASFYGYKDSKEFFSAIKDNQIKFGDAIKKQIEFLNKLIIIKIRGKNNEQKKVIKNLEKFYISREEVINFFKDYGKMALDAAYKSKQNQTEGKGLKTLTPKKCFKYYQ